MIRIPVLPASAPPGAGLRFRLLGELDAWDGNRCVNLGHRKQRAVLATLLLRNDQVVSRDTLIDALWGDAAPRSATNVIQTYIARLRRALEPGVAGHGRGRLLATSAGGYRISADPALIDVFAFQGELVRADQARRSDSMAEAARVLRRALDRWYGIALDGLPGPGLAVERERLAELRWSALERYVQAELTLGRADEVLAELRLATAAQPFRERMWGYLMLALAAVGRRADALGAYQQCRSLLLAELGMEPGSELRRIHQSILSEDQPLTVIPEPLATAIPVKG